MQIVTYTVHVPVHVCRCMCIVCTIFWTLKENLFTTRGCNDAVPAHGVIQRPTRGHKKYFKEMK